VEDSELEYEEAVQQLDDSLSEAVMLRLISDVPLGMFLSGGVDSNTIACLLRRATGQPIVGHCGGGQATSCEEFAHARQCAEHAEFAYGEVRLTPAAYLESWLEMLSQYATPLSTPSDVVLYRLARELKKSVGVVLGGEGADELLCGYEVQHWAGHDYESSRAIDAGAWTKGAALADQVRAALQMQYGREHFASEVDHYFALNSLIPTAGKPALLQEWAWQQAEQDGRMWGYYGRLFDQLGDMPTPRKHQRILHQVNLESLLARLDSSTMLASLEARVPFTDHHLVEEMFRLPQRYKIDVAPGEREPHLPSASLAARGSLRSKRMLRSLAQRLMPAPLANRRKASFPTPVQAWFSDAWIAWSRHTLQQSPFARAVFQHQALDELGSNVRQAGMWLWPLLNLAVWGDRQFAGQPTNEAAAGGNPPARARKSRILSKNTVNF
jgi:asparagine synthase (glutamine-hydrolysing)